MFENREENAWKEMETNRKNLQKIIKYDEIMKEKDMRRHRAKKKESR